jgi:hypothetical protein
VLALIIGLLLFQLAAPDEPWSRAVAVALEGAVLVTVFHASDVPRLMRRGAEAIAIGTTIIAFVVLLAHDNPDLETHRLINVLVVSLAPPAIGYGVLRSLREHGRVEVNAIAGVLCIYLLIGMIFASAYSSIAAITNEAFFTGGQASDISDFLYFSFTTLTTTGYGDLSPAGNLARSFAILEQLIGAIYLVTVVAVLVSNVRPRSR